MCSFSVVEYYKECMFDTAKSKSHVFFSFEMNVALLLLILLSSGWGMSTNL